MFRGDPCESASMDAMEQQSTRVCLIYGLIDPETRLVRYVGKTANGMVRVRSHRRVKASDATHRANWIRSLRKKGQRHEECVLEVVELDALNQAEMWWIAYGRACGWPLTNLTHGGEGALGCTWSPARRALATGPSLVGRRFGTRIVVADARKPGGRTRYRVRCDCGREGDAMMRLNAARADLDHVLKAKP